MNATFKPLALATAVAAVSAGYAGVTQAATYGGNNLGDAAIVPYYTVQTGFVSGIHIINTSLTQNLDGVGLYHVVGKASVFKDHPHHLRFQFILQHGDALHAVKADHVKQETQGRCKGILGTSSSFKVMLFIYRPCLHPAPRGCAQGAKGTEDNFFICYVAGSDQAIQL